MLPSSTQKPNWLHRSRTVRQKQVNICTALLELPARKAPNRTSAVQMLSLRMQELWHEKRAGCNAVVHPFLQSDTAVCLPRTCSTAAPGKSQCIHHSSLRSWQLVASVEAVWGTGRPPRSCCQLRCTCTDRCHHRHLVLHCRCQPGCSTSPAAVHKTPPLLSFMTVQ